MPPRLNKRQLRELEELQALESTPVQEAEEESADEPHTEPIIPPKKAVGGFAAVSTAYVDEFGSRIDWIESSCL